MSKSDTAPDPLEVFWQPGGLYGWRVFRNTPAPNTLAPLMGSSVLYDLDDMDRVYEAKCDPPLMVRPLGHECPGPVPAEYHRQMWGKQYTFQPLCGFHAYHLNDEVAAMQGKYSASAFVGIQHLVREGTIQFAVVKLTGRIVEHDYGMRSSHMQIVELFMPESPSMWAKLHPFYNKYEAYRKAYMRSMPSIIRGLASKYQEEVI